MQRFVGLLRQLVAGIGQFAGAVFGRWEWHPPAWFGEVKSQFGRGWRFLTLDWRRLAIAVLLLGGIAAGVRWYKTRPVPHYVGYATHAAGPDEYDDNGISSIKPLKVDFNESAAPLQQVEKKVTAGIELSPRSPAPGSG